MKKKKKTRRKLSIKNNKFRLSMTQLNIRNLLNHNNGGRFYAIILK